MEEFYCFYDSTGIITGVGSTIDGTIPDKALTCAKEVIQNPSLYVVAKGQVVESPAYEEILKEQTVQDYFNKARIKLDAVAYSWGYDSIIFALSYLGSTDAQYKADAEALNVWRDSFWSQAYTICAGNLPASSGDFLAALPEEPTKPTV